MSELEGKDIFTAVVCIGAGLLLMVLFFGSVLLVCSWVGLFDPPAPAPVDEEIPEEIFFLDEEPAEIVPVAHTPGTAPMPTETPNPVVEVFDAGDLHFDYLSLAPETQVVDWRGNTSAEIFHFNNTDLHDDDGKLTLFAGCKVERIVFDCNGTGTEANR